MEQLFPALIFVLLGSINADYQCVCNYDLSAKVYDAVTSGNVVDTMNEFDCKPLKTKVSGSSWASIVLSDHSTAFVQTGGMVLVQTCPGDPPTAATTTPTPPPTTRKTTTPTPTTTTPKPTPAPNAVKERVCSGGWVAFKTSCYLFPENQNCNFFHAQDFCRSKGAHLVHIDSKAENDFLINHLRSANDKSFWIGLSDHDVEGQWRWSDDDSVPKFTDWNPGEPDGNEWFRRQDCAISLARVGNKWSDVNCMFRQNRPVCEK